MGVETDEVLWRRALAGDGGAFGVIWDRHNVRVLRHAVSLGAPSSDAEDLAATAFLELWRRRDDVRFVDGSLLPWLIVTTHNVHRNAARARRRHRAFLDRLPPAGVVDDHATALADRSDPRLELLRTAMASARPVDARLLAMTALEGLTIREAASALGLSESAAKMRLARLRRRVTTSYAATTAEGEPT